MKNFKMVGLVGMALVVGLAVGPKEARAGSLDFGSSVTAKCLDLLCLNIEFTLNVNDAAGSSGLNVSIWRIESDLADAWLLGSVTGVYVGASTTNQLYPTNPLGVWNSAVYTTGGVTTVEVTQGAGAPLLEPLRMTIAAVNPGSANLLNQLRYTGQGTVVGGSLDNQLVSFSGSVAPEPMSVVLLATGLLGLGIAARARRKNEEV